MSKLFSTCDNDKDLSTRNEYVWFLLLQLQTGTVDFPFTNDPPDGPLDSLEYVVGDEIYDIVKSESAEKYHLYKNVFRTSITDYHNRLNN